MSYVCESCGAGFITGEAAGALCATCVAVAEWLQAAMIREAARAALAQYERAEDGYIQALAAVCRYVSTSR